jgi:hypothetical protein
LAARYSRVLPVGKLGYRRVNVILSGLGATMAPNPDTVAPGAPGCRVARDPWRASVTAQLRFRSQISFRPVGVNSSSTSSISSENGTIGWASRALTFQKGLGAVRAMAHPLGALDDLPLHHGTLNAVLLPAVLRFNETAAAEKYERLRRALGTAPDEELADWVANLNARLGLPQGLAAMGVPPDVLPRIAEHAEQDPASETNVRPVTRSDYEKMLRDSVGR